MKIKTLALVALLAVPAVATADDPGKYPTDKTDTTKDKDKATTKLADADLAALAHVHHVNVMEIDMGKLAQQKGTAGVKRYGETLVRDHGTADKDAMAFAKKHGLAKIPDDKPVTAADQQEMKDTMDQMAKLKTMKGADFDKTYLQMMVDGHEKELAKSDPLIAQATDPELKTMLEGRKTSLQRHADLAKELQKGNAQASVEKSTK
jgi:putative membrane protein